MSGSSSIEWTDSSWSPVVGCTRVSAGCDHCYAVRQTRRLEAMGEEKYAGLVNPGKGHFNGVARLHAPSLDWPLRWRGSKVAKAEGRPSRIFVNPMSDLFHEALSNEAIAAVFGVMAACQQHTFQVLTKRPERMREWFEWVNRAGNGLVSAWYVTDAYKAAIPSGSVIAPAIGRALAGAQRRLIWPLSNVWLGVSVEDQATADERIPHLLATPAAVRFVSYEPALGPVDFRNVNDAKRVSFKLSGGVEDNFLEIDALQSSPGLDWIIVGGESGPGARRFDLDWARSTVAQCKAAVIACFVKQLGAQPFVSDSARDWSVGAPDGTFKIRDRKGGDWSEWPEDLRVREFPK